MLFADEFTTLNSSLWVPELGDGSDYNIPGCVRVLDVLVPCPEHAGDRL